MTDRWTWGSRRVLQVAAVASWLYSVHHALRRREARAREELAAELAYDLSQTDEQTVTVTVNRDAWNRLIMSGPDPRWGLYDELR